MPLSRQRDYLSIGEVLETVREEFPDVSISKIRFLESEGLISPERTSSGYRKFYEPDVRRLRTILALQRDHFLPLKVIKERLARGELNGDVPPPPEGAASGVSPEGGGAAAPEMTGVQLGRDELLAAAGLDDAQLRDLEDYGILRAGDDGRYDEHDLMVATTGRRFFELGVEARHLRMYRQFADREASFFQQLVTPVTRRRDPDASREAAQSLHELLALARRMREGVLRAELRDLLR